MLKKQPESRDRLVLRPQESRLNIHSEFSLNEQIQLGSYQFITAMVNDAALALFNGKIVYPGFNITRFSQFHLKREFFTVKILVFEYVITLYTCLDLKYYLKSAALIKNINDVTLHTLNNI